MLNDRSAEGAPIDCAALRVLRINAARPHAGHVEAMPDLLAAKLNILTFLAPVLMEAPACSGVNKGQPGGVVTKYMWSLPDPSRTTPPGAGSVLGTDRLRGRRSPISFSETPYAAGNVVSAHSRPAQHHIAVGRASVDAGRENSLVQSAGGGVPRQARQLSTIAQHHPSGARRCCSRMLGLAGTIHRKWSWSSNRSQDPRRQESPIRRWTERRIVMCDLVPNSGS